MSYPRVEVSLDKIRSNTSILTDMCSLQEVGVAGVTKVFCGDKKIAQAMVDGGVKALADSRIENLEKLGSIEIPKMLLRLPMLSQAKRVVRSSDISLNSELETIKALSMEAIKINKVHDVILMIDLGDLREGVFKRNEILRISEEITSLKGVRLVGLGTNLTCYGGVIPRKENLSKLIDIKGEIEDKFNIRLEIVSGGNSSSIHLLENGQMPRGINQLRLGESVVLGRETAFGEDIKNTYSDVFTLVAEIVEIKEKPSMPIGEIGMDAFGKKPTFVDKGDRIRAICAVGKQDVSIEDITLYDERISILGGSSDHLILDITECQDDYSLGDVVKFRLSYGGILSTMTSPYVEKIYI